MKLQKRASNNILTELEVHLSSVTFKPGSTFSWSPQTQTVTFRQDAIDASEGIWSLLHESAHAILQHHIYKTDFELLTLEVAAWQESKKLGSQFGIEVDENYIQDCLDTYRDWLHKRSTCPTCGNIGMQHTASEYRCHNCGTSWKVSSARFCRPYRRKETTSKEKPPDSSKSQATFH